ncbi:MAG: hypothetical protein EA403_02040 [Spirochaetaceae bacterium]|nr:MAG: hypothetical protein EA403_02040 [Spirochaetaceae bacterium]
MASRIASVRWSRAQEAPCTISLESRVPSEWRAPAFGIALVLALGVPAPLYAFEGLQEIAVAHEITRLLLQLGVIILFARLGATVAKRLHLPSLLGEVTVGLLLGPYALGATPVPGFPDGLIPLADGPFSVSLQLYAFAAVGAVIHILAVGLESDPHLFKRMSPRGMAVAIGSATAALVVGAGVGVLYLGYPVTDQRVLFFAALSVSTSLGVQARILHSQHRLGSPEGAAIVGSSLLQDGLAIVVLAIAMALDPQAGTQASWAHAAPVALIAFVVWIGGFFLSVWAAPLIARTFRRFASPNVFAMLSVALALVLSAVFETFGVAAIIGAYILGLAFSRTDVADVLTEKIAPVTSFFVPVLYVVMGMLIDIRVLVTPEVLLPGIAFALVSGAAKLLGGGIPALATGFSKWGALRVGLGTVPRGEIALIIGAVGLASGILSPTAFKVMAVMVVFSVAIGSPAIAAAFRFGGSGTRGGWGRSEQVTTDLDLPNPELTELLVAGIVRAAEQDGFFVHRMELADPVYRMRRDEVFLSLRHFPTRIELRSDARDVTLARTLIYEVLVHVSDRIGRLTSVVVPETLRRDIASAPASGGKGERMIASHLDIACAQLPLKGATREAVIEELVDLLHAAGKLKDRDHVLSDVLERERSVSTGMERGVAIPHAKTDGVESIAVAVGVAPGGVDFGAIDNQPSRLIFLIASPTESRGPHLQLLSSIATLCGRANVLDAALKASSTQELIRTLSA